MRPHRLVPAIAVAIIAITAAAALASTRPTLRVRQDEHVTNVPNASFAAEPVNTHEAVAIGATGYAVYTFQGETSHHFICHRTSNPSTNCWAFWPPVTVTSATGLRKQTGISGHLGTVRRHGMLQLTLKGQPLYYFTPDLQSGNKRKATGDELKTFGSIWHIVVADTTAAPQTTPTSTTGGSTSGGGGGYGSSW